MLDICVFFLDCAFAWVFYNHMLAHVDTDLAQMLAIVCLSLFPIHKLLSKLGFLLLKSL